MAELSESLGFNLSDSFTGNVEGLTYLLKSLGSAVTKTEAKTENLCLSGSKGFENLIYLCLEEGHSCSVCG